MDGRRQRLDELVLLLQGAYSPRALRRLRDITGLHARRLPTGLRALDRALAIGGLPRGQLIEISGAATAGCARLALAVLVAAQQRGETVAWIDCARLFDPAFALGCGLDPAACDLAQPDGVRPALTTAAHLARRGGASVVVLDSVPALYRTRDVTTLMNGLRPLHAILHHSRAAALFLNDPDGDGLLAYDAAVRLELTAERWLRRRGDIVGVQVRLTIARNKFGPCGHAVPLLLTFPEEVW